jgi:hypothetical protein
VSGFWTLYALPTGIIVIEVIAVVVPLLLAIAYFTYAERKVLAYSQLRKGPNVVGPFGLFQPIADGLKLLMKETVIPSGANRIVFVAAPMATFSLALVAWAVIPFDNGVVISNINVGLLYLFAISSLSVYGIIMAGWASNSRYAFLGALRSAAQMVSYEVSIGFVLVTVLLCVGSLNLTDIVMAQRHVWFVIPLGGDQSGAVRSARRRIGARRRLFCRIFGDDLRAVFYGRVRQHDHGQRDDRDFVPRRLARAVRGGAVHLGPGAALALAQDRLRDVLHPLGARDLPALSLRPADADRLEGVFALHTVLAGADRGRPDRVRLGPGALTA